MQRKLTITVSDEVYRSLHAKIGAGKISRFIDRLARAHLLEEGLREGYAAMAADEEREREAEEWTENLTPDATDEAR
jgi:predicted CopG family antitoxin